MSRIVSLMLILTMLLVAMPAHSALAQQTLPVPNPKDECEIMFSGKWLLLNGSNVCVWIPVSPLTWNSDLVIFAHGYVDPLVPDGAIPWDQLVITDPTNGTTTRLPDILLGMGYAFAVTSYSKNGLAVTEGVQAVNELAAALKATYPVLNRIFLVGASEGGLVTALAIEQNYNNLFKGGLATCGPVGDFNKQISYWGDFRVLLDYFFPPLKTVLNGAAGSPVNIPDSTRLAWGQMVYPPNIPDPTSLQGQVSLALLADPSATAQLMRVSQAPYDYKNKAATIDLTVRGILDYNIKATNEAKVELKGQPFDNSHRHYFGSLNDSLLNKNVERFPADPSALESIKAGYQTTGKIKAPLVDLHTTGDPIVPFWHEWLYQMKIWGAGKGSQFFSIPVPRYGHCAFTAKEAIFGFAVMIYKSTGKIPLALLFPQAGTGQVLTLDEYNQMMLEYGPKVYLPMTNR